MKHLAKRHPFQNAGVLALVTALALLAFLGTLGFSQVTSANDKQYHFVPIGSSAARGPQNAKVTVVVFSDFECPFCSRLFVTLEKLRAQYKGKLRFVVKHVPMRFHRNARRLAVLSEAARNAKGDKAFFRLHDRWYSIEGEKSEANIANALRKVGLTETKLSRGKHALDARVAVDADLNLAKALGLRGTPMTFVNGEAISGAQPFETFERAVKRALSDARSAKVGKLKGEALYRAIVDARTK